MLHVSVDANADLPFLLLLFHLLQRCPSTRWYWKLVPVSVHLSSALFLLLYLIFPSVLCDIITV